MSKFNFALLIIGIILCSFLIGKTQGKIDSMENALEIVTDWKVHENKLYIITDDDNYYLLEK